MSDAAGPSDETPAPQRPGQTSLFDRLRGLFGAAPASVRDDIEDALDESGPNADFTPQERAILKNVLGLNEVRVKDLMIPRADIIGVEAETPLSELLALFRTAGHSRLPVYGDNLDDPRGMVHIRDFVDFLAADARFGLAPAAESPSENAAPFDGMATPLSKARILRPVLFAPPSMPALDLLVRMQASHTHMALVIDEYGGTDGLVSIEDVVEAIVGDIEDEHDEAEIPEIARIADGSLIVEGRAGLEDVSKALGVDLSKLEASEDIDTIGGLIAAEAGRVPGRGEVIAGPQGLEFEILDADPRRIKRAKIHANRGAKRAAAAKKPEAAKD